VIKLVLWVRLKHVSGNSVSLFVYDGVSAITSLSNPVNASHESIHDTSVIAHSLTITYIRPDAVF